MKALRLVLLAIACVVMTGLVLRMLYPDWTPEFARPNRPVPQALAPRPPTSKPVARTAPSAQEAREAVLSRIADAPTYEPFFGKLRSAFPGDYTTLIDDATQALLRDDHLPNPDRLLIDAMRRIRQSRGILASQAESGPLASIFAAQRTVLDLLAGDNPSLCADFLYGGSSPDFMAFAATHRDAVERLALSNLDAVVDGQAKHVEHPQPTSDDMDALSASLKAKGLSDNQIAAVLDGKTFDPPLPAPEICQAGRAYLQAVQDMPDDARDRVYALSAALLARS